MSKVYLGIAGKLRRPSIIFSSCDSLEGTGRPDDDEEDDSVSPLRRASSLSYPPNYYRRFIRRAADAASKAELAELTDHTPRSPKPVKPVKGSSSSWTTHLPIAFGAHQVIVPSATATRPSKIPSRSQSSVNEAAKPEKDKGLKKERSFLGILNRSGRQKGKK
uniref:Uncharacterized protein n=1 Tax=Plectus sambesii TaxID=2011161 RepID=A0A914UNM2_9BILA